MVVNWSEVFLCVSGQKRQSPLPLINYITMSSCSTGVLKLHTSASLQTPKYCCVQLGEAFHQ